MERHIVKVEKDEENTTIVFKNEEEDTSPQEEIQEEKIQTNVLYRLAEMRPSWLYEDDEEEKKDQSRSVDLAFSSEQPVARWFGMEVLDHEPSSIRLGRLLDGAPVLVNHDPDNHVGVVETASIDDDRMGRAKVRFGSSQLASEVWKDIQDGIRKHVSVGYIIHRLVESENSEDSANVMRAMDWEPMEISIASIPADVSVGLGRTQDEAHETLVHRIIPKIEEREVMENIEVKVDDSSINAEKAVQDAQKAEMERVREILAQGKQWDMDVQAEEYVRSGKSIDAFRVLILEKIQTQKPEKVHEIGLTPRETREFSWMRLIRALANPSDKRMQEEAGFEFEASRAQAEKSGIDPQGAFVPADVVYGQKLQRDLTVGSDAAGGYTVQTDVLAESFIDVLRANMIFSDVGVTELNGLNGKVSIPGISAGSTAYWVAENGAITESDQTFIARTMSGKTVGAMTDVARNLMLQSSMDIEAFVRNDIARNLAVEIENKGMVGDGSSNAPTGVNSTTGVTSEALATADTPLQADIVAMWKALASNNALRGNLNWVGASTALANMMATPRTATYGDIMILDPNQADWRLMGYPVHTTENAVFSSINKLFFGDWSSLVMGSWGNGLDLIVDPYTNSNTGAVRVVGLYLVDFCVRNPKSFAITTNP